MRGIIKRIIDIFRREDGDGGDGGGANVFGWLGKLLFWVKVVFGVALVAVLVYLASKVWDVLKFLGFVLWWVCWGVGVPICTIVVGCYWLGRYFDDFDHEVLLWKVPAWVGGVVLGVPPFMWLVRWLFF